MYMYKCVYVLMFKCINICMSFNVYVYKFVCVLIIYYVNSVCVLMCLCIYM